MHHASICANVVIGVLVVLCELHVTRVIVVDVVDAVVGHAWSHLLMLLLSFSP